MHGNCFLCIWSISLTGRWFLNLSRFLCFLLILIVHFSLREDFPLAVTRRRVEAKLQFIYWVLILAKLQWFASFSLKIESIKPQRHLQLENDSNFPSGSSHSSFEGPNLKFCSSLRIEPCS